MPDRRHVMWNERLAWVHPSTDRRFLRPGFLGDKSSVSGMTRSPLASDATDFFVFPPHNCKTETGSAGSQRIKWPQDDRRANGWIKCSNGNLATYWICNFATKDSVFLHVLVHSSEYYAVFCMLNPWNRSSHSSVKGVLRVKLKLTVHYLRKVWSV